MTPKSSKSASLALKMVIMISMTGMLSGQLTFSKSWVAGGGKRSSLPAAAPLSSSSSSSSPSESFPPNQLSPSSSSSLMDLEEEAARLASLYSPGPVLDPESSFVSSAMDGSPVLLQQQLSDLFLRHKVLQDLLILTWKALMKVMFVTAHSFTCWYVFYCTSAGFLDVYAFNFHSLTCPAG